MRLPLAIVVAALITSPAPSAPQSSDTVGWTPELHMRYHQVGGTALSPDGSLVAYVVREPVMEGEKSEYLSHIWVARADGSRNVQFTRGEKSASDPRFSPDGRWLAFTSSRSERSQVWVMPVDGGEAEQVTDAKAGVGSYDWSPDGSRIAYTMTDPKTEEEEKAEKEKRDVILVDQDFKYAHLYVVPVARDADGKRPSTRLTEGDFHVTGWDWTPDGRAIVYAHQPDPRINTGRTAADLSIVNADGGAPRALVTTAGIETDPLVSPDGRWVAYVSTGMQPEPIGLGDVYVVGIEGGTPRRLAETPDRSPGLMAWAPDGSEIYLQESVRTERDLIALPLDGEPRIVTEGDGVFGSLSLDANASSAALTFETPDTPPDVYIAALQPFSMRRLTNLHANVPKPAMGRTVVLTWTSNDGIEIEGLLTYPVGYREGSRVPLILNVHGGPAGVFSENFTGGPGIYMLQYFAQNGYAVLRPNPRGSTGYGRDFRYANFQDWGFGDYQDLMAGVDHVIELGVAHPDSLAVMGWSYGGYMTSWVVTQTDRFKAASMGAGLPNLVSMVTTTDIGDYLVGHFGGEFWEDYETYEKHSAIYHIEKTVTPTQVIHGQQDLRVPFTQGQEFYTALSRLGVPTEFVVYPRTPHGPREPKLLMDVSPRIMAWFEKHLRGAPRTTTQ